MTIKYFLTRTGVDKNSSKAISYRSTEFKTCQGTLTIYDYRQDISAENITFDEGFTGKLNIYDYGYPEAPESLPPACTISASTDVIISGGSFDLISYNSNGINALPL